MDKPYRVSYLPLFYDDLLSAAEYISVVLKNTQAANKLVNNVEEAILNRLPIADKFEKYHSAKERKYPYYRIYVGNYVVYYVVIPGDPPIMEIRRFLYVRRNKDIIV